MSISMIDSAAGMRRVLDQTPQGRADAVRDLWAPMAGMYHFIPGIDLLRVHAQNLGRPRDSTPRCGRQVREAIAALDAGDAGSRVRTALQDGAAALAEGDPGMPVPDLQPLLLAGDPTNHHFLDEIQGLSAFGGISGYISVTLWPTELVLDRLEAIAVHELHHNMRYSPGGALWHPDPVTVCEHVAAGVLGDL